MIIGRIGTDRRALLTVQLADSGGVAHPLEFQLDTGFNGWLTLPLDIIDRLELAFERTRIVSLADGREAPSNTYNARALWHGRSHNVYVVESPSQPLLGMSMLWGSEVTLQAWDGGDVIIEEVDPRDRIS